MITYQPMPLLSILGLGSGDIIVLLVFGGLTAFWFWMFVEALTKEPSGSEKIVWILVMLFTGWIGAAIYYFMRRQKRIKLIGK
jgi:hypothetical protein